jgi:hypothetical protein
LIKDNIECPLIKRRISEGYCFELCNIATDEILLKEDKGRLINWKEAQRICKECGRYED